MSIDLEMEQMAEKMEKSFGNQEVNADTVKAEFRKTIESLGVEGLKKAIPALSEEQKYFLKEVLEEMKLEKSKKGEGSKGGKVIGHTKSGKPIYDSHGHEAHSKFDRQDHMDAARLQNKRSMESSRVDEEHEPAQQIDPHLEAAGHDMKKWHEKRRELGDKYGEAKEKHKAARNALTDKMSLAQLREFHSSGKVPKSAGHQKRHAEYEAASKEYDKHYKNINEHHDSHPADKADADEKVEKSHKEPIMDKKYTTEPDSNYSTEQGDYMFNEDKRPQWDKQDEKLFKDADKKKQQEQRNQGGVPTEGWEGQEIEVKSDVKLPEIKMPEHMKKAEKEESMKDEKSEAKDKMKRMIKRMQERKMPKEDCYKALSKAMGIAEDKIAKVWDLIKAQGDVAEASQSKPAPIMEKELSSNKAEDNSPEMPAYKDKSAKKADGKKPLSGEPDTTADAGIKMQKSEDADLTDESNDEAILKSCNAAELAKEYPEELEKGYMGFEAVKEKAAAGGAKNPAAVAAAVGRKKYGNKRFNQMISAGKPGGKKGKPAPGAMKKSDNYFYEEEAVYEGKNDVFKSNTFGKNTHYNVDAFIESSENAHKERLSKSTFDYEDETVEPLKKSQGADKTELPEPKKKDAKKPMSGKPDEEADESMAKVPKLMKKASVINTLIETKTDMDETVMEQAYAVKNRQASGAFLVKSFNDADMDAAFDNGDMWKDEKKK